MLAHLPIMVSTIGLRVVSCAWDCCRRPNTMEVNGWMNITVKQLKLFLISELNVLHCCFFPNVIAWDSCYSLPNTFLSLAWAKQASAEDRICVVRNTESWFAVYLKKQTCITELKPKIHSLSLGRSKSEAKSLQWHVSPKYEITFELLMSFKKSV